jgi:Fe-S-cluster containining protein
VERARPWYREGLRFECSRCGDCCRGSGHVWVTEPETERIRALLGISQDDLGQRFLRRVGHRLALTDGPQGDCVFWEDGCTIYPARPSQCRTFPFWQQNLATPRAWNETVQQCPGAGEGRLYRLGEIETLSSGNGRTKPVDREDPGPIR